MTVMDVFAATAIATRYHEGQMYGEHPYMYHIYDVTARVVRSGASSVAIICAILHDIVEDTSITIEQIENFFGKEIADVVSLLTKLEGESKHDQVTRIIESGNINAMAVKWADSWANLEGDKSGMDEDCHDLLIKAYTENVERLEKAIKDYEGEK